MATDTESLAIDQCSRVKTIKGAVFNQVNMVLLSTPPTFTTV